ncbi:hypothetical protein BYT27DRAFT_6637470 [Phlegmacium glaucopus]|nr:hypothetical protein BYT27DRAFT_6637470 [Phlegmacium glaucopus]
MTSGYNSAATQANLIQLFQKHFGGDLYNWQLDVTEAILLGLDMVVIAGRENYAICHAFVA